MIIFLNYDIKNKYLSVVISFCFNSLSHNGIFRMSFSGFPSGAKVMSFMKFRVLTSLLTLSVSCLGQNFPASLKIEETVAWLKIEETVL